MSVELDKKYEPELNDASSEKFKKLEEEVNKVVSSLIIPLPF